MTAAGNSSWPGARNAHEPGCDNGIGLRRSFLRTFLSLAGVLGVFLLAGVLGYRAYLATPPVPVRVPEAAQHAAVASRAVIFVIDAFTPSRVFDPRVMPALNRLAAKGASGIAHADPVTMTATGIFSLMTGQPGTFEQAVFNFHSSETRTPSLLSLMAASGRKITLAGDPAWHRQFGWLTQPEDLHEAPDPGITVSHEVDEADARSVAFLIAKLADPAYGITVVHVGSVDAVGHAVTPHVERYYQQLTFIDGLIEQVAQAIDPRTTLLLITGDHGMASRGTHGGEEEARLTPYVLVGHGVKPGVVAEIPHTALPSTLSALLGLPFLPVSEYPPLTNLLDLPSDQPRALKAEYFDAKLRAVQQAGGPSGLSATAIDDATNARLNAVLFGAEDSRRLPRALAAAVAALGILGAAILAWRSLPDHFDRPPMSGHLVLTGLVPLGIVSTATVFMLLRAYVEVQSITLATWIMVALVTLVVVIAVTLYRSPQLLSALRRWQLSLFFPTLVLLCGPLVNSQWVDARPYFEVLLLAIFVGIAVFRRADPTAEASGERSRAIARATLWSPALAGAFLYAPKLPSVVWHDSLFLPVLSVVVIGLALRNLRSATSMAATAGRVLLCSIFATAWVWRLASGPTVAAVVLALFALLLVCAALQDRGVAAAALLIGAGAGLFLIMAADRHEACVFLVAAAVALVLSRQRIDLSRPGVLYAAAGVAILLRIFLYYELGDQYNVSSIRTVSGSQLSGYGLDLGMIITLLLVKYSLPWLLIFGMALPSLIAVGPRVRSHVLDLLVLGYVARFAVVEAVIDPFRSLPNAMNGIVGTFCCTWADLVTFILAVAVLFTVLHRLGADSEVAAVPAVQRSAA